ncbi:MAG: hypothetical protein LBB59_00225 [Campylobacteraceae bacterium]|jgi:hypothetical protein|nr:hypothetical protein [Campylobacteraceae bacterium]
MAGFDTLMEAGIINHYGSPNEFMGGFLFIFDMLIAYFSYHGIKAKIKEWKMKEE